VIQVGGTGRAALPPKPLLRAQLQRAFTSGPALNLLSGYFCFASMAACGLVSLPVAVHFLDKERIGLWSLISQMAGYLIFLELGVGAAAGRMLADPLASNQQEGIDRAWSTLLSILAVQGVLITVVGCSLNFWLVDYFRISPALAGDARFVWVGMTLMHAVTFPLRAYTGVLLCQERFHWTLLISGCTPWINLAGFAVMLAVGCGLRSYVFATLAVNIAQFVWLRHLLRRGPHRVHYRPSRASWQIAKPMLGYSSSIMLWSIAPAIVGSIPSIVLGRHLGLESVSLYLVSYRVPQVVAMLALRSYHAFYPKLQNLFVTQQRERFLRFYRLATALSLWMTGLGLVAALGVNRFAVGVLSRPDYYAGDWTTLWFVLGFILLAWSEHLGTLFIIAGKAKWVSIVLLVEVVLMFVFSTFLCPRYGMAGVAAAIAMTPLLVRIPYYALVGPRTCSFGLGALYGTAALILSASLLVVAGAFLICHPLDFHLARTLGILITLAALACGGLSCRRTWLDLVALRATKAES